MNSEQYYIDKARILHEEGYDCAQSVLLAFEEFFPSVHRPFLIKISEGLGGGMGGRIATCGAVSGGAMALSLYFSNGQPKSRTTYPLSAELSRGFFHNIGSLTCSAIKGTNPTNKVLAPCPECINTAVRLTLSILRAQSTTPSH